MKVLAEGSYGKVILARSIDNRQGVTVDLPHLVAFKVFTMQVSEEEAEAESEAELYEVARQ